MGLEEVISNGAAAKEAKWCSMTFLINRNRIDVPRVPSQARCPVYENKGWSGRCGRKTNTKKSDLTSALKPKLKTSANCGCQWQIGPFTFMGVVRAPPISCAIGFWKCVEQNPFSELIYSRWGSCHKMPIICFELLRLNLPVHLLLQVEQTSVRASRWDFSPLDIVFLPPNPVNHLLWFYTTSLA